MQTSPTVPALDLSNRVALITGATGQLGRLVVEQLPAAGAPRTILATGRDTNKLTALLDDGVTVGSA